MDSGIEVCYKEAVKKMHKTITKCMTYLKNKY